MEALRARRDAGTPWSELAPEFNVVRGVADACDRAVDEVIGRPEQAGVSTALLFPHPVADRLCIWHSRAGDSGDVDLRRGVARTHRRAHCERAQGGVDFGHGGAVERVLVFAIFTGVLLWLSSLFAAWVDNWFVLHQLSAALRFLRSPLSFLLPMGVTSAAANADAHPERNDE